MGKAAAKEVGFRRGHSTVEFTQHLFKLDMDTCKKDIGLPEQARIEECEHIHFFRTISEKGKKLDRTEFTNGHFHYVEWEVGDKGLPVVTKVSEPMIERYVTEDLGHGRSHKVKKVVALDFYNKKQKNPIILDKHTHKGTSYLGYQQVSTALRIKQNADDGKDYKDRYQSKDENAAKGVVNQRDIDKKDAEEKGKAAEPKLAELLDGDDKK